jgi:hypothetical protein
MDKIRCIATTLERALRYGLGLLPYKFNDTKVKSMGAPSHCYKNVAVVRWNFGAISFPRSYHLPEKMVQICIEGKKIHSGSCTLSFVAWIHKLELACINADCHVNLVAVCISSPKSKEPSKVLIGDLIPPPLHHPMEFSCISPLLNIQGGKEFSDYLIVPILLKGHNLSQVFGLTCSHHLIKDEIMLVFHVISIYPL